MNSARFKTIFALLAVAAVSFLFHFRPIQDDDAWLHFAAGRWILDHGAVPRVDEFSCTAPGVEYVDHEWLAQWIFELTRRASGLTGFRVLVAGCAALAMAIFAKLTIRAGASGRAAVIAALGCLAMQWHVARARPQVFTLLCVALLADQFICKDRKITPARAALFAAICIFWASAHAACVIAPVFVAFAAAGAWLGGHREHARRLAVLAAAAGALLLVNPYGWKVYTYALETQGLAALIPEWKSILTLIFDPAERARATGGNDFRTQAVLVGVMCVACAALSIYVYIRRERAGVAAAALAPVALLCAAMPFVANRHDLFMMLPFAFCSISLAVVARENVKIPRAAGVAAAIVFLAVLGRDADYRFRNYLQVAGGIFKDVWPPHEPWSAVDFIEKAGLRGRCLNRPSWGGYLLFRLHPGVQVSFDGRITTLGAGVYQDHVDFFNGKRNREIADRYQFDFAIVLPFVFGYGKPMDNLNYVAPDLSQDWLEVYRDEHTEREGTAVVALRRASPHFEENLQKVRALKR